MTDTLAIIGNGISGITTARYVRKRSSRRIVVISAESDHFFSRTALMYVYMGHMRYKDTKPYEDSFWRKNKIELMRKYVERVDAVSRQLYFSDGGSLEYKDLVIATGSVPNKFGWPGQELKGVQGLYSLQDLQLMEANTKGITRSVIVGGGLIGVEMAEMLKSRNIDVTMLVRESHFWGNVLPKEEGKLVGRHIESHGVELRLNTLLKRVVDDGRGKAAAVEDDRGENIPCDFVGLTAGVSPNISFLEGSGINTDMGVMVDPFLRTNIENIYAAGDCAQQAEPLPGRQAVEQVWYTGRMMGEVLASTLCGEPQKYEPGPWFNSAKLFDIEFQTYGQVGPDAREGDLHLYWEHDGGTRALRLVGDRDTGRFLGVNALGLRLRHEQFDNWLRQDATIDEVMESLENARFDPEFSKDHFKEIKREFGIQMTEAAQ